MSSKKIATLTVVGAVLLLLIVVVATAGANGAIGLAIFLSLLGMLALPLVILWLIIYTAVRAGTRKDDR